MGNNKNRHEIHNRRDKTKRDNKPTLRIDTYTWVSTDKQREYAKDMVRLCEEQGIDLSFARPRFYTKDDCKRMIRLSYTMLEKHGYDISELKGE